MGGWNFPLIVVLFILLIIVGCGCIGYGGVYAGYPRGGCPGFY